MAACASAGPGEPEAEPAMSNTLLDYSSWSFQLIVVLGVLYLVTGLIQPSWVLAKKRLTVAVVGILVLLIAGTAFYIAVRPFDSMPDGSGQINAQGQTPAP
jgi:phosphotransferase system  glucose/maltose/N-acetylglucosamine-specific IIC component